MIRAACHDEMIVPASKMPYILSPNAKGILYEDEKGLGALVIYDAWTHNAAQMHIYSVRPNHLFDKRFLREVFRYPFVQCDKGLVYVFTPADAKSSLAVSKALGFKETYRMKDGWAPGIDMVVKEMKKADCRWLQEIH